MFAGPESLLLVEVNLDGSAVDPCVVIIPLRMPSSGHFLRMEEQSPESCWASASQVLIKAENDVIRAQSPQVDLEAIEPVHSALLVVSWETHATVIAKDWEEIGETRVLLVDALRFASYLEGVAARGQPANVSDPTMKSMCCMTTFSRQVGVPDPLPCAISGRSTPARHYQTSDGSLPPINGVSTPRSAGFLRESSRPVRP